VESWAEKYVECSGRIRRSHRAAGDSTIIVKGKLPEMARDGRGENFEVYEPQKVLYGHWRMCSTGMEVEKIRQGQSLRIMRRVFPEKAVEILPAQSAARAFTFGTIEELLEACPYCETMAEKIRAAMAGNYKGARVILRTVKAIWPCGLQVGFLHQTRCSPDGQRLSSALSGLYRKKWDRMGLPEPDYRARCCPHD